MKIEDLFLKRNGAPSITRTAFGLGFLVCILKLILSGVDIGTIKLAAFTGSDFAVAIAALGGIYTLDKKVNDGK